MPAPPAAALHAAALHAAAPRPHAAAPRPHAAPPPLAWFQAPQHPLPSQSPAEGDTAATAAAVKKEEEAAPAPPHVAAAARAAAAAPHAAAARPHAAPVAPHAAPPTPPYAPYADSPLAVPLPQEEEQQVIAYLAEENARFAVKLHRNNEKLKEEKESNTKLVNHINRANDRVRELELQMRHLQRQVLRLHR